MHMHCDFQYLSNADAVGTLHHQSTSLSIFNFFFYLSEMSTVTHTTTLCFSCLGAKNIFINLLVPQTLLTLRNVFLKRNM